MILGGTKDTNSRMTDSQIESILHKNSIDDLQVFIKRRACLNNCNIFLTYVFHLLQTGGMIVTTISASYNYKELLWIGISLNAFASLISIYEKINQSVSDKMLESIKCIKSGEYLDEAHLINTDEMSK